MESNSRQRLLIIITAICVGALFGDRLVFSPMMNLWDEHSKKIVDLEKSLSKGRMLIDRETNLRQQWEEMSSNSLPKEKSMAEIQVSKAWDRWVTESGVNRLSFKPQWKEDEKDHLTLECRAIAQGNLATIARFLYELEKEKLPLKLHNIEITANDDKGEKLTVNAIFSGLRIMDATQ